MPENKCGDCLRFSECKEYTTENETFPEVVGGCEAFRAKRGQWVEKPSRLGSNYKLYGCSICGWTFTFKPDYNYCPRCGAYMKEGAKDDSNV